MSMQTNDRVLFSYLNFGSLTTFYCQILKQKNVSQFNAKPGTQALVVGSIFFARNDLELK